MQKKIKFAIAGATLAGAVGIGVGALALGAGASGDDQTPPITGPDLEQAKAAALAATGEGRVTQTEVGDEDSYYEVEVTLDDGSQVDVQLDEQFNLVKTMSDSEGDHEGSGASD